jgi:diguanylate cyclase (GGDEF)-like protein
LPDRSIEAAVEVAERLRGAVAALDFRDQPGVAHVTASIGAARWNPAMNGISDLLRAADKQLYAAKSGGRDRVCAERTG